MCLNKFTELLLLNGIIDAQQMWESLSLVANMYECMRGGQPPLLPCSPLHQGAA